MADYLAPGVFVEEISFQAPQIQPASTSIAGMVGPARFGPAGTLPQLLTSFNDFLTYFGDAEDLSFSDLGTTPNYSAYAAQTFFDNGGQNLYFARVYNNVANTPGGAPFGASRFADSVDRAERHHFPGDIQRPVSGRRGEPRSGSHPALDGAPVAIRDRQRRPHVGRHLSLMRQEPGLERNAFRAGGDEPASWRDRDSEPDCGRHLYAGDGRRAGRRRRSRELRPRPRNISSCQASRSSLPTRTALSASSRSRQPANLRRAVRARRSPPEFSPAIFKRPAP